MTPQEWAEFLVKDLGGNRMKIAQCVFRCVSTVESGNLIDGVKERIAGAIAQHLEDYKEALDEEVVCHLAVTEGTLGSAQNTEEERHSG